MVNSNDVDNFIGIKPSKKIELLFLSNEKITVLKKVYY